METLEAKKTRLQKELSDKTLSFGCMVKYNNGRYEQLWYYIWTYDELNADEDIDIQINREHRFMQIKRIDDTFVDILIREENIEILWHPVYLHNVILRLEKKEIYPIYKYWEIVIYIISQYKNVFIPRDLNHDLMGQSEETIDKLEAIVFGK